MANSTNMAPPFQAPFLFPLSRAVGWPWPPEAGVPGGE